MQTIRTTITLPHDLHQSLRAKAFKYHTSLNDVILTMLREKPEKEYQAETVEEKIAKTFAFFDEVAKMGKKIDAVKAVREERDRDDA